MLKGGPVLGGARWALFKQADSFLVNAESLYPSRLQAELEFGLVSCRDFCPFLEALRIPAIGPSNWSTGKTLDGPICL